MRVPLLVSSLTVALGLAAGRAAAQTPAPASRPAGARALADDGPPAPELPNTVSRDGSDRVTVRAVRLDAPLVVDGRLDDAIYGRVLPMDGFIQQEPREGDAATEQTQVWVFFDASTLYVSARCLDSHPEREIVNERRRDHVNIYLNENFIVAIDTYHDRRNSFLFQTNPLGALRDGYITDERVHNPDWSTVWNVRSRRDDRGWTLEMAIPFKSLRYQGSGPQVWGINFLRVVRWKNELSHLTRVPAAWGARGIYKASSYATLVGVEPGAIARNLEIKPYATGSVRTDNVGTPRRRNEPGGDLGADVKLGLTKSLTGDFTYNTDFAQVEDDEQQVNLTRFSVFFPEKREFFLEGQGIFQFGGVSTRVTPGALTGGNQGPGDTPVVFFSRRIGLNGSRTVPILAGGRVTGRAGKYSIGAIDIQTGESEDAASASTNFSVLRVRRDVLKRGSIGILATNRDVRSSQGGSNQVVGMDLGLAFRNSWTMDGAYVRSDSSRGGHGESYWTRADFAVDRYQVQYEHLYVGPGFDPDVGFLRRRDFRRNFGQVRFSPRLAHGPLRQVHVESSLDYVTNPTGRLETRVLELSTRGDFRLGDTYEVKYLRDYEYLARPFDVASGVRIPVGGYAFQELQTSYSIGPQRRISGRVGFTRGEFFDGDRTETSYSGRVEVNASLMLEPAVSLNWVDLPYGSFRNTVARTRATYTLSPRSFVGALVQYASASHTVSANVRFRWEYQPGSDLFVVYTEGRDTDPRGLPALQNRGVVVKFTRLFRF
ncbi:MAG: DUF5916 domain-containing protein [Vicinamibacterales bacterium]